MSTDKDGTQGWHYFEDGLTRCICTCRDKLHDPPYVALVSVRDATVLDAIIADHRKAAKADALAAALTNISDEIMAGGGDPITLRIMAREAQVLLASYVSNPAEAGA